MVEAVEGRAARVGVRWRRPLKPCDTGVKLAPIVNGGRERCERGVGVELACAPDGRLLFISRVKVGFARTDVANKLAGGAEAYSGV